MKATVLAMTLTVSALGARAANEDFRDLTLPRFPAAVHYYAAHPVEAGSADELAAIVIHGWSSGVKLPGEAISLHKELKAFLGGTGKMPYILAPVFPTQRTMGLAVFKDDGRAHWCDSKVGRTDDWCSPSDDWRGGGDANNAQISSYEVIDRLLTELSDRTKYPNLKRIVLVGYSAGGQFVGRYVAVGKAPVRAGLTLDYAPMAPSTWLRLQDGQDWLYGLRDRPRYAASLTREDILANLGGRRQWNGCGDADVLKRPETPLDSTPMAEEQGPERYSRFLSYRDYVKGFPAWAAKSSFHVFKGVGHAYREAFKDPVWLKFLVFGD